MLRATAVLQTLSLVFQVTFILELAFTCIELDLDLNSISVRFTYRFILEIYVWYSIMTSMKRKCILFEVKLKLIEAVEKQDKTLCVCVCEWVS